jgi:hypothetical protein
MMNPLKKQNKFYCDIERVLFIIHMMVASAERNFLKLKYFCELFTSTDKLYSGGRKPIYSDVFQYRQC